jgi:hypothetical protein
MVRVVYNACYGGFGLSNEAKDRMVELGYEMELNPSYDPTGVDWYNRTQKYKIYDGDIPRHNPILIQVVEELGEKAGGECSKLVIEEVYGPYRIDEYDGFESVETPGSYDWINPYE